jgi:hypothetical protein
MINMAHIADRGMPDNRDVLALQVSALKRCQHRSELLEQESID